MTKNVENQQNLSINFKLKLIKIKDPIPRREYNGDVVKYNRGKFNEKLLREIMEELFYGKNKT